VCAWSVRTVDDDAPHTGEHKSDLVTRLNPRGQLPVYEEGDIVIPDSLASIIWIEEQHGKSGTLLLPPVSERKRRALVRLDILADAPLLTAEVRRQAC
jgi:glutathione S-transferase